jgi:hypothetical protein
MINSTGQATAEYALISLLLLGFGSLTLLHLVPGLVTAFGDYLHGYYLVLSLPIP